MTESDPILYVRMPPALKKRLERYARQNDRTISGAARLLIAEALTAKEKGNAA